MGKDLYQSETICYRIFDPEVGKFCCSGRGLYAKNGRSVWFGQGVVHNVFNGLPQEVKERAVIKLYKLVELEPPERHLTKMPARPIFTFGEHSRITEDEAKEATEFAGLTLPKIPLCTCGYGGGPSPAHRGDCPMRIWE